MRHLSQVDHAQVVADIMALEGVPAEAHAAFLADLWGMPNSYVRAMNSWLPVALVALAAWSSGRVGVGGMPPSYMHGLHFWLSVAADPCVWVWVACLKQPPSSVRGLTACWSWSCSPAGEAHHAAPYLPGPGPPPPQVLGKRLTEMLLQDWASHLRTPAAIVRPTLVSALAGPPYPGYTGNLAGG